MRYGFALALVVIVLFSISAVAAGENITPDASSDDGLMAGVNVESISDDDGNGVDLSVKVDGTNKEAFDSVTVIDLPFNVTASVDGGVAHDVKVRLSYTLDEYFEYASHNTTLGTYNTTTKIWDIGDLTGTDNAVLTMLVKLNPRGKLVGGTFIVISEAQTTSNDTDISNNFLISYLTISSGSIVVIDSDEKELPRHDTHENSDPSSHVEVVVTDPPDEKPTDSSEDEINHPSDENPESKESLKSNGNKKSGVNDNSNGAAKQINQDLISRTADSLVGAFSNGSDELASAIAGLLNPNSNSTSENSSDSSGAGHAYDYTRIPIIIFSLFLIILVAIVGYGRFKS